MQKSEKIWQFIFVALAILGALALILGLSAGRKPQWREIKSASTKEKPAYLKADQLDAAAGFGGVVTNIISESEQETIAGDQQINFLVLGAAGQGYDAPDLTDTILVASFEADSQKMFLFSLPRDLLVKIPGQETWTKLNALYAINKNNKGHEFDLIKQKVQEITGLAVAHYVLVDLTTVKEIVDTLGGINVMVEKDLLDTSFPGLNHSYQTFEIKAGWRYLDGETALKYIRSRHSQRGDFDRIARQQQVLQTIKQKILSLNFWDISTFVKIFEMITSRIKTDLSFWQMKEFWDKMKGIAGQNVIKTEIDNAELVETGQTNLGGVQASVVRPRAGLENYQEIIKYVANAINI
jgi:LCP family protein required for cell wall assembly